MTDCRFLDLEQSKLFLKENQSNIISCKQVHGSKIIGVEKASEGNVEADGIFGSFDNTKSQIKKYIAIRTADCMPIVFIDNKNSKFCLVHAGWRGLVNKVFLKPFVDKILNPKASSVYVGPSLSSVNFQVKDDMIKLFSNKDFFYNQNEKVFFNAWEYVNHYLVEYPIKSLENKKICTYENKEYASYRRYLHKQQFTEAKLNRNITYIKI